MPTGAQSDTMDPMRPAPRPNRLVRRSTAGIVVAVAVLSVLTGCVVTDLELADTPLEVTATEIGYRLTEPVVGEVVNPEGPITVTMVPAPVDPRRPLRTPYGEQDVTAAGVVGCGYASSTRRYSCPTAGLPLGRYVVQVTDAGMPSEGTASVEVALQPAAGYEPAAGQVPFEAPTSAADEPETFEREAAVFVDAGKASRVPLTGWAPDSTVQVQVRADNGRKLHTATVPIGASGTGTLQLPPLPRSDFHTLVLSDTVWVARLPLLAQ